MYILGVNAYHPDSSACIIKDGQLLAAVEEERFRRIKHWAGFPSESIRYCLKEAGVEISDIDYIGISRNPYMHIHKKFVFALKRKIDFNLIKKRIDNVIKIKSIKNKIRDEFYLASKDIKAKVYFIEHHQAHIASTFFISDFKESAVLSLDAMGDFVSTMFALGKENKIKVLDRIYFPHSLGYLYTAGTQFLGFFKFGDEYKVMGLAGYGKPGYLKDFKKIIIFKKNGKFILNPEYFNFSSKGLDMSWNGTEPVCGILYSKKWVDLFGPARKPDTPISEREKNIASSLQAVLEEAYFHILEYLYKITKLDTLCLAGGVALNCSANGKIFGYSPFKKIYIQPASSDAGTALGCAYYIYHQLLKRPRCFVMDHAYWGPEFSDDDIELILKKYNLKFIKYNQDDLVRVVAGYIQEGKIIGWFQGRMEWGPRALGNRSILVDPRKKEMIDKLNSLIKHRESFRPFAPSILEEEIERYLGYKISSPFMLLALPVKKERISEIIATVHIDNTIRLQTVSKDTNYLFWKLIKSFSELTGVAALLNTSFNENEPIVCKPEEALECFLRTPMDILVMKNYLIKK